MSNYYDPFSFDPSSTNTEVSPPSNHRQHTKGNKIFPLPLLCCRNVNMFSGLHKAFYAPVLLRMNTLNQRRIRHHPAMSAKPLRSMEANPSSISQATNSLSAASGLFNGAFPIKGVKDKWGILRSRTTRGLGGDSPAAAASNNTATPL